MRALAQEQGVQVMIGMNHRFRPDVVNMKNAVDRGEIGAPYYVKAGWVKQRSTDARWLANADISGGGVLVVVEAFCINNFDYLCNSLFVDEHGTQHRHFGIC